MHIAHQPKRQLDTSGRQPTGTRPTRPTRPTPPNAPLPDHMLRATATCARPGSGRNVLHEPGERHCRLYANLILPCLKREYFSASLQQEDILLLCCPFAGPESATSASTNAPHCQSARRRQSIGRPEKSASKVRAPEVGPIGSVCFAWGPIGLVCGRARTLAGV